MAELNSSAGSLRGKSRSTTISPRVDMTPMVDLMFLLITFFMLTTTLSKPSAMQLAMPVDGPPGEIADYRTINLCLAADNKIQWYMGSATEPLNNPQNTNYSVAGLRKVLNQQNVKVVQKTGDKSKGLIVLIKPGDNSNYQNLVDVLDELEITNIDRYMIVDNSPEDISRMKTQMIY